MNFAEQLESIKKTMAREQVWMSTVTYGLYLVEFNCNSFECLLHYGYKKYLTSLNTLRRDFVYIGDL